MNISDYPAKVPEPVVRSTAVEVFVFALMTILLRSPWPAVVLSVDFGIRSFLSPRISPLALMSGKVWVPLFGLNGPLIFYTPKRFAARIGFVLSLAASIILFLEFQVFGLVLMGILGLFSFLEGGFGYCVGCRVYGLLVGRGWLSAKDCPDCVR